LIKIKEEILEDEYKKWSTPVLHLTGLYAFRAFGAPGFRKTAVGLWPLCGFTPPTVWAGVNASHCPITCPDRRIQPERYTKCPLKMVGKL
jgi:hypothetical protein